MTVDYLIRAETKEVWQNYALEEGWLIFDTMDGPLYPAEHVRVDELGPVVVTPGTYDEEGNELTPPVMDTWHHVNLRALEAQPQDPAPTLFASGRAVVTPQEVRALEAGDEGSAIQLLFAEDIATPIRVWADGMHHIGIPGETEGD